MIKGLEHVLKPGRYIGGEINQVVKPDYEVRARFALAFPDAYEIGMSHSGLKILYHILNSINGIWAQRVFAPWPDMLRLLEDSGRGLYSLEEKRPLREFDVVGFSLMHELSFSTVLRMLRLSGILIYSHERKQSDPIVIAGGTSTSNPCPVLPFFDLFVIGDGEEVIREMAQICLETSDKKERISAMSDLEGVYLPGSGKTPVRRILSDLDRVPFPSEVVVPNINIIHDRLSVEVARGCTRGCRFCQAGMIYRPYRERSFDSVINTFRKGLKATGYDNLAMTALSITDLSYLHEVMESLVCPSRDISIGVPSMRVEGMTERMADIIASVKKPGFTLAVEAATERLRAVINKGNTEEELMRSLDIIKRQGWKLIKLYFMIGLPTETDADIQAIIKLTRRITNAFRGTVNVSISTFIPKVFTPFQWEAQMSSSRQLDVIDYLKRELKDRRMNLKWTDTRTSLLEGVFSRGDEKLSEVIELACRNGAYLDGWNDTFRIDAWMKAFEIKGIKPNDYLAQRPLEKTQPWEFIDMRLSREFLLNERRLSLVEAFTPDCRKEGCSECGACSEGVSNMVKAKAEKIEILSPRPAGRFSYTIGFTKEGLLPLIGNRDFIEMLKRIVRRSGLKAFYSEGFSPVMKLSLIPPVALGIASLSEYMQLELCEDMPEKEVADALSGHMLEGSKLLSCRQGKMGQVASYTFRYLRPCRLNFNEDSVIVKGDSTLKVMDYIERYENDEITIKFVGGRIVSALALADAFGDSRISPLDIIKTQTAFAG